MGIHALVATRARWCRMKLMHINQTLTRHGGGDGPEDTNGDPDEGENFDRRHPFRPAALHLCLFLLGQGGTTGVQDRESPDIYDGYDAKGSLVGASLHVYRPTLPA